MLFEDADLLFIDKPAGLLSVPGKDPDRADSVERRLRASHPGSRLIHRLDMDTSGVMVFARSWSAQRAVNRQFERRQVAKTYTAIVAGRMAGAGGSIALPLTADWPNRPLQKICQSTGKFARTRWQRLACTLETTRLALHPITGRSHQLRLHLRAIGHPILGDRFYAPPGPREAAPRLCLHATRLTLTHPMTGAALTVDRAPPF